jgi:hypothetical protein
MWSDDSAEFKKIKEQAIVFQTGEELRYNQTNFFCLNDYRKISSQSLKNTLQKTSLKKGMKNRSKGMGDFFTIINHSAKPYTYYINGSLTNIYQPIPKNLSPAGTYSTAIEMAQ